MEKTFLIAGKDNPEGFNFASGICLKGHTVIVTSNPLGPVETPDNGTIPVVWNRSSALSSRSLVLSSLNHGNGHLDCAVLIFDEENYAPKYGDANATESNKAFDDLILGYQYLTSELISRFSQKKLTAGGTTPAKLVFLYKSNPSQAQAVLNPNLRSSGKALSKSLVAAAGASFKAFSENVAALLSESEEILPVLVECDDNNELGKRDTELASWLSDYLGQLDSLKKGLTPKQKVSWIKAGAKSPQGFSLFK